MSLRSRLCASALLLTGAIVTVPASAQPIDSTALLLQQVIRVNTANPPGRTQALAELLAPMFTARGFEVEVVPTPDSAKVHFFARLRGNGTKKPILLAAHADVVGVEREKWTVEPFDGVVKNGDVYGRGAIDFKGGLAVFARAAMLLADRKVPLDRDIIFLAEADEEGMPLNTSWLAKTHWDRMDAEFSLNEGGWIIKRDDGRVRYVSISTADKVSTMFRLASKGTSTHASMPLPDNALVTVGKALAKLASFDFPIELTAEQRQFFTALAKTSTPADAKLYRDLLNGTPSARAAADRQLSKDPLIHSLIRTTIAPVIMSGGFRSNVIPGSAEAMLNVRLIPGTDTRKVADALTALFNDPLLTVVPPANTPVVPPSSTETELYQALAAESKAQWPEAEVTPYLFQAGTDAAAWRGRGVPVYGIYPYPITMDELKRMHGNDEKVSIESLRQGTEMIYRTLVRVAGKR